MIHFIEKELKSKSISPVGGGRFLCNGKEMTIQEAKIFFINRVKDNKKMLLDIWLDLGEMLLDTYSGNSDRYTRRIFIVAIQSLHNLACYFQRLHDEKVVDSIQKCLNSDSNRFSSRAMLKVIEYNMGIEWLHHLIMKDYYICSLLSKWHEISSVSTNKNASGASGPWSNLDHPMAERVYEWRDIEEEITGRTKDRQRQPRYYMGLEGYGTPRVNEGFVWEELRRYPYDFDDEDNNPYPHRNLLWKS